MFARGIGFAALILVAALPQPALAGGAAAAEITGSRSPEVGQLVLRLRPGVRPADGQPLSAAALVELQRNLGVRLAGATATAGGNQILLLETPVSAAVAAQLVNTLRLRGDVVWAELGRGAGVRKGATKAAAAVAASSLSVRRLIVTFADAQLAQASRKNASLGATQDAALTAAAGTPMRVVRAMSGGAWLVQFSQDVDVAGAETAAARLESSGVARFASPDYPVRTMLRPNDFYFVEGDQWNLEDVASTGRFGIDATHAWDITTGASGMVVAVVDSGIVPHPDLDGRVLDGYDFVSDPADANDGNGRDPDATDPGDWRNANSCPRPMNTAANSEWHGTLVAGVIAANTNNSEGVAGIDWNTKILPVRVLGRCGGDFSDILNGMAWAAGLPVPGVPDNPHPAKVINLSAGGDGACNGQVQRLLDEILDAGVFIAVAAGNDNVNADGQTPAGCAGVSTVGATDEFGTRASYSNFSTGMDISAPGGDQDRNGPTDVIVTTWNSGRTVARDPAYADAQGTSFSTPEVAGVAALMLAVNPALLPAQIKALMAQTASPFAAGSTCVTQGNCGAGILNAFGAVKAAQDALGQSIVPVVEYYHQALDHYFITALPSDISLLDGGAFPGWVRTGQSFHAYPAQSMASLSPVCRFFIPPQHGDSHFFSAASADCAFLLMAAANPASDPNFSGYIEEYAAAFYVGLPDATGECPAGTVPVFRLWNQRQDSNHRYTTDAATVAQMQARNYVLEGAAPNFAAMCAAP
jgi:serine protease